MTLRPAIVNGKQVMLPASATVADARNALSSEVGADQFVELSSAGDKPLADSAPIKEGGRYQTIPKIVKGVTQQRLQDEIALLKAAAGGRSDVVARPLTIDSTTYIGVMVKNVRLESAKFNVSKTDMLFLLSPSYPEKPPIGCYVNYEWETADHHFTLMGHYGAPSLTEKGWYWYCAGLGGGFNDSAWRAHWRPGARAESGHNLSTLFISARLNINTGD